MFANVTSDSALLPTLMVKIKRNGVGKVARSTNQLKNSSNPAEIVIEAVVGDTLLTGNIKQLVCGLTAIQTNLGWALLGKMPHSNPKLSKVMVVTSMLVDYLNISGLWK